MIWTVVLLKEGLAGLPRLAVSSAGSIVPRIENAPFATCAQAAKGKQTEVVAALESWRNAQSGPE